MILITSHGEIFFPVFTLLLVFLVLVFSLFILGNPNHLGRIVSWSLGVCPVFIAGIFSGLEIQRAG